MELSGTMPIVAKAQSSEGSAHTGIRHATHVIASCAAGVNGALELSLLRQLTANDFSSGRATNIAKADKENTGIVHAVTVEG